MQGPFEQGTHNLVFQPSVWSWEFGRMERGRWYRIRRAFQDADGHEHHVGDTMRFIYQMFDRQHNITILCIEKPDKREWEIPLAGSRDDAQEDVLDSYLDYLELLPDEVIN